MIDPADHVPLYAQLAAMVRQQIMAGMYVSGDTLPPEDDLVRIYGVSRYTRQAGHGRPAR